MCLACYNIGAVGHTTVPPIPTAPVSTGFNFAEYGWTCYPSGQLQVIPPPPIVAKKPSKPAPAIADKPTEEKPPKKKAKTFKPSPSSPPELKAGASYVFPKKHTYVHAIRNVKVWEAGAGTDWSFKIHRVPTSLTVNEFLDAMMDKEAEGSACTEVVELGDGDWSKVSSSTRPMSRVLGC